MALVSEKIQEEERSICPKQVAVIDTIIARPGEELPHPAFTFVQSLHWFINLSTLSNIPMEMGRKGDIRWEEKRRENPR